MGARWCLRSVHRGAVSVDWYLSGYNLFLHPIIFRSDIISLVKAVLGVPTCTGGLIVVYLSLSIYCTNTYVPCFKIVHILHNPGLTVMCSLPSKPCN